MVDWSRPLALREWKEWGYHARPWINGVFVTNYHADALSYAEIEKLAESLLDEHGNEHPEVWIPGVQHPSLPPRPPRWSSDPAPYWSGQCELNPYLRRKLVGEPPLFWDMGKDPSTAVHGHNLIATPLLPPDRAQAATWPMTTHFFISALADDVEFKWPILIRNKHGVTVQDVLEWIYANFQEAVDCDEWATWPMYLRTIATISYDKRGERDYLKRIDYLGFHSMFRGFEHSPDGQSWYLYVGRPY
ncbi:hypothetical protein M378DRAFT_85142 [Amanita muscaria Koide BX008]|uniref:DUF6699 domain-containing protein n=1 Tax=Amanita muscaria (strain Koide BX008) TaxID=946122 RepID=A0A0C2WDF4_AMAMK|nr:hypothetical protein M378DRAFT_85142 [Amanita muscaria Koide BX008]